MKIGKIGVPVENISKLLDSIDNFYPGIQGVIGTSRALVGTDYENLLEKIADIKISQLGTPIIDHVTFYIDDLSTNPTEGSTNVKRSNIINKTIDKLKTRIQYDENAYKLLYARISKLWGKDVNILQYTCDDVILTVNRPQKIVETTINGLDYTTKQFISLNDYQLTFDIKLAGFNRYQEDTIAIDKLNLLFSQKKAIKINSIYLNNIYNIKEIVIKDFTFQQEREYGNMTSLSVTAVSHDSSPVIVEKITINNEKEI